MKAPFGTAAIVVTVLLVSACSSADDTSTPTSLSPTTSAMSTTFATTTAATATTATTTTATTTRTTTTTTRAADAPPGQVTGVMARTGGGSGEVVITWTQNPEPDVASYTISRAATSGGALVQIGTMTRAQVNDFPVAPYVDV